MPLKKANKIRRNFTLDPEVVAKIEILSKYLEFQINYSQIVEKAINDLFEKKITPHTQVIHFSHITYPAGQIFPDKCIFQMVRERESKLS